jgi:hypothetical protein
MQDSNAVFSYNPEKTQSLLQTLSHKERFINPELKS